MDVIREEYFNDEDGLEFNYSLLKPKDGKFHFVATNDNKVYASAQTSPLGGQRILMLIENIFVDPQFRGVGIGGGLLDYMESSCKEAGFAGIFAKVTGDEEKLYLAQDFFTNAGYVCGNYHSRITAYSVEEIVNSRFKEIMDKLKGEKSIKSLDEIPPHVLKELCKKMGIDEKSLHINDKKLSKMAISGEEPHALILCEREEDTLCVRDIVLLPENKDKGIMMRILSTIIKDCIKNKITTLVLRTENNSIEVGLAQCMVSPKTTDFEMEFVKSL